HNPEFTQVELYVAYKDYNWMMDFVEAMVEHVALAMHGSTKITVGENEIDFKGPWPRIPMFEAIEDKTGLDLYGKDLEELRDAAEGLDIQLESHCGKGKSSDQRFGEDVEPEGDLPTRS